MPVEWTNPSGIPEEFVNVIRNNRHRVNGDLSVTTLIDSAQVAVLKANNVYQQDVADMLKAMMGTALHKLLEEASIKGAHARKIYSALELMHDMLELVPEGADKLKAAMSILRHFVNTKYPGAIPEHIVQEETLSIMTSNGLTISGTFDHYNKKTKTLRDYKSTSVWAYIFEGKNKSWTKQTNVYAYMLEQHGYPVDKIEIVRMFTDWSPQKRYTNSEYPPSAIMSLELPKWDSNTIRAYIDERADLHKRAIGGEAVECTEEEMWYTRPVFAVMKRGNVRAVKRMSSKDNAEMFISDLPPGKDKHRYYIEERKGIRRRCITHCPVGQFCKQRADWLRDNNTTIENEKYKLGLKD